MQNMQTQHGTRPLAIVTGGLRGIGAACAARLAGDFDVAVIDLAPAGADTEAALAPMAAAGARVGYYPLDISEIDRHAQVLSRIREEMGVPACLINNAGIAARPLTDVLDLAPEAFDRSLDVNLRGTFFLTQAFARMLLAAPDDAGQAPRSIVTITSIAAEMASTDRAQYCIGKSALSMACRLFAARLAPHGIAVHEVRPGFIRTDMTASAGSAMIDQWIAEGRVPMPRWGQPEDVAAVVSTLAAGRLPYVTGQPIWVAGGLNIARAT